MSYSKLVLPTASSYKGMIRVRRDSAYSIPNNAAPYAAHTYPMEAIDNRSSEIWTLNAAGEIVIPEGVSAISAAGMIYWGNTVPASQYTIAIKRLGSPSENHFANEYFYDGSALYISVAGVVEVVPGNRIAIGLRQGTGGPLSPLFGFLSLIAFG